MTRIERQRLHHGRAGVALQRVAREIKRARFELTVRERTAAPASGPLRRTRRGMFLHPHAQLRHLEYAPIAIVQPMVPPAHRFLQEADRRTRTTRIRILVRPRTDDAAAGHVEIVQHTHDGVRVSIGPTADHQHRATNCRIVLADRAVAPISVALRMCHPGFDERRSAVEPLLPQFAPTIADHLRIRRLHVEAEHRHRPAEHLARKQRATLIVHVVVVSIVGGAHADNRAQRRWCECRHLQRIEAAPRDAHHADAAVAPRLRRKPSDQLDRVAHFLRAVLIHQQSF